MSHSRLAHSTTERWRASGLDVDTAQPVTRSGPSSHCKTSACSRTTSGSCRPNKWYDILNAVNSSLDLRVRQIANEVRASVTQERLIALLSGFFGTFALIVWSDRTQRRPTAVRTRRAPRAWCFISIGRLPCASETCRPCRRWPRPRHRRELGIVAVHRRAALWSRSARRSDIHRISRGSRRDRRVGGQRAGDTLLSNRSRAGTAGELIPKTFHLPGRRTLRCEVRRFCSVGRIEIDIQLDWRLGPDRVRPAQPRGARARQAALLCQTVGTTRIGCERDSATECCRSRPFRHP